MQLAGLVYEQASGEVGHLILAFWIQLLPLRPLWAWKFSLSKRTVSSANSKERREESDYILDAMLIARSTLCQFDSTAAIAIASRSQHRFCVYAEFHGVNCFTFSPIRECCQFLLQRLHLIC